MGQEKESVSTGAIATERFNELLEPLLQQGQSQAQIATKAGIPPQYFSDIKRGERPVTELIARRLGEEYNVDYRWLMGTTNVMELSSQPKAPPEDKLWLPLFPFPITGEPRQHQAWNGATFEVAGVAASKCGLARLPYVLQFGRHDQHHRLQKDDLILISQEPNPEANIHVVMYRKKCFLARATPAGSWERLAEGERQLPSSCQVVGHCLAVVWSPLA